MLFKNFLGQFFISKSVVFLRLILDIAVMIIASLAELMVHTYQLPLLIPQMVLLCTFLCIFLGIFSGFTKNIIAESGEELDSYESREDFQAVVKDYQHWVNLFVNNITRKTFQEVRHGYSF